MTIEEKLQNIDDKLAKAVAFLAVMAGESKPQIAPTKPTKAAPVVELPAEEEFEGEEEPDDLAGETEQKAKITLTDVQDAIRNAANTAGREKTAAALLKFGAKRGTEVKEADFEKVVAALAKLKK